MRITKNTLVRFALIVLTGIIVIIRLTPVLTSSYDGLMSDDAMYMGMARAFYEGNLYGVIHPFWMPLYPLLAAFSFIFVQNWVFAAILASAIPGILIVIPLYFVGKYYANRLVGLLAVFFSIFFFPLMLASHTPYAESLQIFLFWMGFLFYLKTLDTNKKIFAFLSGIFWGLMFLTRTEGLFAIIGLLIFNALSLGLFLKKRLKVLDNQFKIILSILFSVYLLTIYPYLGITGFIGMVVLLLFFFGLLLFSSKNTVEKVAILNLGKATACVLIGFSIFYLSYNGALILKYKKPLFSAKASAFLSPAGYSSMNKEGTSTWGQDVVVPETFNPNSEFTTKKFYETAFFKKQNIITGVMENTFFFIGRMFYFTSRESLVLFFIGMYWLIFKAKDYSKKTFLFLTLVPMIFFISVISIDTSERYVYFVSLVIPLGIAFAINYVSSFFKSFKVKILILFILIFFTSYSLLSHSVSRGESISLNMDLSAYRAFFTGEKAKSYKPNTKLIELFENKRVMGRHEGFGFKYRSLFIYSPTIKNLEELVSYARRWHVDYIIASSSDVNHDVSFLYEEPKDYPGLKLDFLEDHNTYIYKVIYEN